MYKKKIFYSMIIFEILMCYILLFESIAIYNFIYSNINDTYEVLGTKDGFILEQEGFSIDYNFDNQKKVYDELINNTNLNVGLFFVTAYRTTETLNFNITKDVQYPQDFRYNIIRENTDLIPMVHINRGLYKYVNFDIIEGESFLDSKVSDDEVPVIAGYDYKNKYKLGDTIVLDGNIKYKIVGFLKKDENFLYKSKYIFEEICNLNSFLIAPSEIDTFNNGEKFNELFNNLVIFPNNKSIDKNYLNDVLKKNNLDYEIKSFKEEEESYIDRLGHGAKLKLIQVGILNIFVIFGLVSIIMTSIIRRKREFGVRFALGYTKYNIINLIFKEFASLVLIAYALCLTYYKIFPKSRFGDYIIIKIGFVQAVALGVVSIIILIIIIVAISYRILKLQPHKLIGGEK